MMTLHEVVEMMYMPVQPAKTDLAARFAAWLMDDSSIEAKGGIPAILPIDDDVRSLLNTLEGVCNG